MKRYSVAEARASLPKLLDEVDRGATVEISRRGKVVARLVPPSALPEEGAASREFRRRLDAWREKHGGGGLDRAFFDGLRDRSESGR